MESRIVSAPRLNGFEGKDTKPRSALPPCEKPFRVERSANGGASYLVMENEDIGRLPRGEERDRAVSEFFQEAFSLEDGSSNLPRHVMAIVRGAAKGLPDPLRYLAKHHPQIKVHQQDLLSSKDQRTTTLADFYADVQRSIMRNNFRTGPLKHISLVGISGEEKGGYYPDLLRHLEKIPFLHATMPWGPLSCLKLEKQTDSDDGPILWVRPGEQLIPADLSSKPPAKRQR